MFKMFKPYRKAIVAGLLAFGAVLYAAMSDDVVSGQEWVEAAITGLTVSSGTWLVPNTPKAKSDQNKVRMRTGRPPL